MHENEELFGQEEFTVQDEMIVEEEIISQEDFSAPEEVLTLDETIPQVEVSADDTAEKTDFPATEEKNNKMTKQGLWKDTKEILVILMVFMLVYVLFFRVVVVVGDSMNDTLVDGDRLLLISSLLYRNPEQGDIIVASKDTFKDGEPIIKRVIATEGQVVDIDFSTSTVYVDGVALTEPYISTPTSTNGGMTFPLTVPEGCVFVMGDNRMNSLDSRSTQIGIIDEREILGKAVFLVFPGMDDEHDFELGRIGALNHAG